MELQDLYGLMDRFAASGLTALEWEHEGERVALKKEQTVIGTVPAVAAVPAPAPQEKEDRGDLVTAPLVGVFYAAPAPGEAPFAAPGDQVKKGAALCLIEAMKMMSEVPAPADCVVEEVLAKDGEAVGYGAPLFRIRRV
ncbi:acetyl-CoA carboxylase biotin carboxyl carrier protein subunit [bacterium 1xD42-67]|nr:acetyl-CoA carboxylase biotin carboxyl carrier protein subunit [bacterium 1xD42-67]